MKKIKLSELLEYGKRNYNSLKLDDEIKQKLFSIPKRQKRKSLFLKLLKYSSSGVIAVLVVFIIYNNYFNIYRYSENFSVHNKNIINQANNFAGKKISLNTSKKAIIRNEKSFNAEQNIPNNGKLSIDNLSENGSFEANRSTTIGIVGNSSAGENSTDEKNKIYYLGGIIILVLLIYLAFYFYKRKK